MISPAANSPDAVLDRHGRPLRDLRISVIDACNFRCNYCMPLEHFPDHYRLLHQSQWLTPAEIERLVGLFATFGIQKLRLTGGEPLLRRDLPDIVRRLTALPSRPELSLTTNGSHLARLAATLHEAGLQRLNVSLDALDPAVMAAINGRPVDPAVILDAIAAAKRAGFAPVKVNMVVIRGVNDHQVLPLVEHFRGTGHIVRFIEYMDVGNLNQWRPEQVVTGAEIVDLIHSRYPIRPVAPSYYGEVADRYRYLDGAGEIGLITSVSQPFCGTCTRARLTADGKLLTCLFAHRGLDLRTPLRDGADDATIAALIRRAWLGRADRYSEERASRTGQALPKVEMYHVGG